MGGSFWKLNHLPALTHPESEWKGMTKNLARPEEKELHEPQHQDGAHIKVFEEDELLEGHFHSLEGLSQIGC